VTTELLRLRGLFVGYGDVPVLRNVHLTVGPGECVALIGANGAGKSTLLRTIAGLLPAQRGSIGWCGADVTASPAAARVRAGVALVPEGKHLFRGMTVRDNLLMGAYTRGDRRQIERDLERVFTLFPALGGLTGRISGTLSGGEQQMCSIGRGLMARPRLLMVDELSLGLSPMVTAELLARMVELVRDGLSLIVVEQDVLAALRLAHRAYVIGSGQLLREGTADELIADPAIRTAYIGM